MVLPGFWISCSLLAEVCWAQPLAPYQVFAIVRSQDRNPESSASTVSRISSIGLDLLMLYIFLPMIDDPQRVRLSLHDTLGRLPQSPHRPELVHRYSTAWLPHAHAPASRPYKHTHHTPTCNHDTSPSRISDSASTSDHCAFPRDTFAFTSGSTVLLRRARPKSDCPENLIWPPLCAIRVTDHTRRISLILSSPSHILHARTGCAYSALRPLH